MRVLVIGGTRFVGRHLVDRLLTRGHEVTLFHRGVGEVDPFPTAEHRHGDRDEDLSALDVGRWDVTLDVSAYLPRQVRTLAATLGERAGHYCYISTVSVYADPPGPGSTEDAPLAQPADPEAEEVTAATYGALKARCEQAAGGLFGSLLVVRPTYVVGPDDYTGRFPRWVLRLAEGGEVLAPGPPDAPMQYVDVRDLAAFTVGLVEDARTGVFHVATPTPPFRWADLLTGVAGAVAPRGTALTWVHEAFLRTHGVTVLDLPLWGGGDPGAWALAVDPARAVAAGLAARPLAETARDTLAWARSTPGGPLEGVGLSRAREAALLAAFRSG